MLQHRRQSKHHPGEQGREQTHEQQYKTRPSKKLDRLRQLDIFEPVMRHTGDNSEDNSD
ncbi:hypothetical protein D3C75_1309620 [compost metagenome]